jgi:TFIIH basal transcription factor complex TTD-A subunit
MSGAAGPLPVAGSLLTMDPATKQLVLYICNENVGKKIIVQDLDDTHVLVNPAYVQYLKNEVARLLEKNMYDTAALKK